MKSQFSKLQEHIPVFEFAGTGLNTRAFAPSEAPANDNPALVRNGSNPISITRFTVGLMAIDAILLTGLLFLASFTYHVMLIGFLPFAGYYLAASAAFSGLFVGFGWLNHHYLPRNLDSRRTAIRNALLAFNVSFVTVICILFLSKGTDYYSRGSFLLQYIFGIGFVIGGRYIVARSVQWAQKTNKLRARSVVLVGSQASLLSFGREFQPWNEGVQIAAAFALPPASITLAEKGDTQNISALTQEIARICRELRPDDVVLLLPFGSTNSIAHLTQELSVLPVSIHLAPEHMVQWFQEPVVEQLGGATTLRLVRPPLTDADQVLKRVFDVVVASTALLVLSPVFLAVAVAIKFNSRGPVLFRQQRHGFNQDSFRIFKFRSMTTQDDGAVVKQAQKNDSRITSVGKFLRRTNIDELPQLLNVVLGDMSLVGPRPHALAHNREFEERIALYARRHNVKPGITGWAQVNGFRGETDTDEKMKKRVACDLYYIDNWSFMLDIKIMFLTVFSRKAYRNAY